MNHRRPLTRLAALAAALMLAALTLATGASPASAHAGNQSYLYLDITPTELSGRIEAPLKDIETGLGLGSLGTDDAQVLAGLTANQDFLYRYFDDHLELSGDGIDYPTTFTATELFYSDLPEEEENYIIFRFTADVGGREVPRAIDVRFDPFFDEIEGRDALLLIGNDWQGGVVDNGHEVRSRFAADSRSQTIDLGDTSWVKNFKASAKLGVNHIRTGPDHILFVLVLLLPSVLVFGATGWRPTRSFGASLWRVLKVVSMFTVAHSITFTLAGLNILPLPPPRVVESIIAISIAAAALHNIRPLAPNKEWLIAFAFGLFHGMGFASLVGTLDVPRSTQLVSLLARNVGIEIGQAVVVLLFFPGLFLLRRTREFRPFFVVMSILFAVASVGWMIERVFETELGVSTFIEPAVHVPEIFVYAALFTAAAAAVHWFEQRSGRLAAIDGEPLDDIAQEQAAVVTTA
ncbi:MAG: HupE/UreJ family protein [Acidimicrobiales bacterium]